MKRGSLPQAVDGISREPDATRGAGVNPADLAPVEGAVRVKIEKA